MDFFIYGIFGQTFGGNQARFSKIVFVPRKGVKNEAFPILILAFKIFIFIVFQNHHFANFFKSHILSFLLMSGLCAVNSIQ